MMERVLDIRRTIILNRLTGCKLTLKEKETTKTPVNEIIVANG